MLFDAGNMADNNILQLFQFANPAGHFLIDIRVQDVLHTSTSRKSMSFLFSKCL
jgi:hypothetical protein